MKSPTAAALLAADSAETEPKFHTANAEGIFENAEQVFVLMRGGNICHFLLAHTPAGWVGGHKFFTRQPHNRAEDLPTNLPGRSIVPTRWAALAAEAGVAMRFFCEHGTALEALTEWIEKTLPDAELEALRKLAREIGLSKWANKNSCEEGPSTTVAPSQVAEDATLVTPAAPAPDAETASTVSGAVVADAQPRFTGFTDSALEDVIRSGEGPGGCTPDVAKTELERRAILRATVDQEALALHRASHPAVASMATEVTIPPRPHYAELGVGEIGPGDNPRKGRSAAAQAELVESIRTAGQLQPVAVLDLGEGASPRYRLIFGEGRWLAHQTLGRATIEAKVFKGIDAATAKALALVENLLRHDAARMADQTGKDVRTIRRSLSLMKLPEAVRVLVREEKLSLRQASSLIRYVVPFGGFEAKAEGFIARPEVAEALALAAVEHSISSDVLANGIPSAALWHLVEVGALVEVNGSEARFLYCWPETPWPALKKAIDKETREAAAAKAERATKRVETAAVSGVSVPLTALKDSKAEHVVLTGDLEIYADYLPDEIVGRGIDPRSQAEVFVCTQPEKLKALRDAERAAIEEDRDSVIGRTQTLVNDRMKKLKKIGPREMALIAAIILPPEGRCLPITLQDFAAQGIKPPKNFKGFANLEREDMAKYEPVEIVRLLVVAELDHSCQSVYDDDEVAQFRDIACWILDLPKLGLIEEDKREREKLLQRLAAKLFGPSPAAPGAQSTPAKPLPKKATKKPDKKPRK
jgi:hypothetical protein